MSYDRVIKDSDDEEDSLPGDLPATSPPPPLQVQLEDNTMNYAETLNAHPDINFDQFIQGHDAPQAQITSSQQQREERWIPSAGAGGSIGEWDLFTAGSQLLM